MRRRRPIVENMTEVAAAPAAMHLGAGHAVAAVGRRLDRAGDWIVEARPTGAALEFFLRGEQRLAASGAGKSCLLYTSDAADEEDSVDLGGRRIIKKKKK